jgi:maltooligosyltrehalose trehalohydrolase
LNERAYNAGIYELYRTLLDLRRNDPVLVHNDRSSVRASALGAQALAVQRWYRSDHRLLIANFGAATTLDRANSPGLSDLPPSELQLILSTSNDRFGGTGETVKMDADSVYIPARSAVIVAKN